MIFFRVSEDDFQSSAKTLPRIRPMKFGALVFSIVSLACILLAFQENRRKNFDAISTYMYCVSVSVFFSILCYVMSQNLYSTEKIYNIPSRLVLFIFGTIYHCIPKPQKLFFSHTYTRALIAKSR